MYSKRINRFKQLILIFLFLMPISLSVNAKSYTIEIKGIGSLSEEASYRFRDIISKSEVLWGDVADVDIEDLLGCRHNMAADPSTNPYIYGHGYINCVSGNAWSTIMSYEITCAINNNRILYWSNPNVYYNGMATGTATYENNSRVWNERAYTVAAFRQNSDIISYTSLDNNTDAIFEDIEASTQITTGNGYEIQNGQTVLMNAGTGIRLTANTHIKSGANFRASTGSYISSLPMRLNEEEAEEPEPFDLPASMEIYPSENDNVPSNADGKTYNHLGQPVDETYHGIVIQNGQKRVQ